MRVLLLVISALSVQLAVTSAATVHDNHRNIDDDAATALDSSGRNDIFAQVAASVLQHDDGGFVGKASVKKKQGRECIVEGDLKRKLRNAPDVRLLSCNIGETCVADPSSSSGGRCAVVSRDGAAATEPRLEEECRKCHYPGACHGVKDQSKIGCGSCNAPYACQGLGEDVTIGDNSCTDFASCFQAQVNIGSGSCNAYLSCYCVSGDNVSNGKCNTVKECRDQYTAPIEKLPSEMPSWAPSSTKPSEIPSSSPMPSISPSEIPSSSPMPSISSTFAAEVFEFVAHGGCQDAYAKRFCFAQLNSAPVSTNHEEYCKSWCLQNDRANFVGLETWVFEGQKRCRCLFAKPGGLTGLSKDSYTPHADGGNGSYSGVGTVGDKTWNAHDREVEYDLKCFRKINLYSQSATEETEAQLDTIRGYYDGHSLPAL